MDAIVVEVRAAEGGADAKDLVGEQFAIYARRCARLGLAVEIADERPGFISFRAVGAGAGAAFKDEPGGHRWQRVPPTEKHGRPQSSTVTVAVMTEPTEAEVHLEERDLEITTCRGSGPGGQARNMTASAVQVKHRPTGVYVRCDGERSQFQNKRTALAMLRAKLWQTKRDAAEQERASDRRSQVGSGMRGDKRRTVRVMDEQVVDHVTGRRWRLRDYLRGEW
jgi:peptide chain release factor 1